MLSGWVRWEVLSQCPCEAREEEDAWDWKLKWSHDCQFLTLETDAWEPSGPELQHILLMAGSARLEQLKPKTRLMLVPSRATDSTEFSMSFCIMDSLRFTQILPFSVSMLVSIRPALHGITLRDLLSSCQIQPPTSTPTKKTHPSPSFLLITWFL